MIYCKIPFQLGFIGQGKAESVFLHFPVWQTANPFANKTKKAPACWPELFLFGEANLPQIFSLAQPGKGALKNILKIFEIRKNPGLATRIFGADKRT